MLVECPKPTRKYFNDLTGRVFFALTVIHYFGCRKKTPTGWHHYWLCRCQCGVEKPIAGTALVQALTKSCGCLAHWNSLTGTPPSSQGCKTCKKELPFTKDNFFAHPYYRKHPSPENPHGLLRQCKQCYMDQRRQRTKDASRAVREEVIRHYSNGTMACCCCGEHIYEFLTIDHIGGGGRQHRKTLKTSNIYFWLRHQEYPKGYRVLCYNCNCCLGRYGYCPHTKVVKT